MVDHSYVADGSHRLDACEGKISVDSAGVWCECGGSGIRDTLHVSRSHPDDAIATRRCAPPVNLLTSQ